MPGRCGLVAVPSELCSALGTERLDRDCCPPMPRGAGAGTAGELRSVTPPFPLPLPAGSSASKQARAGQRPGECGRGRRPSSPTPPPVRGAGGETPATRLTQTAEDVGTVSCQSFRNDKEIKMRKSQGGTFSKKGLTGSMSDPSPGARRSSWGRKAGQQNLGHSH